MRLLELMAYVSEATEDMLDMDIVSNFISAAMLLKELDSIIDDIMAWWAEEEEKDDDSSTWCISFFIIIDELVEEEDDDSLWVIIADPASDTREMEGKQMNNNCDQSFWKEEMIQKRHLCGHSSSPLSASCCCCSR